MRLELLTWPDRGEGAVRHGLPRRQPGGRARSARGGGAMGGGGARGVCRTGARRRWWRPWGRAHDRTDRPGRARRAGSSSRPGPRRCWTSSSRSRRSRPARWGHGALPPAGVPEPVQHHAVRRRAGRRAGADVEVVGLLGETTAEQTVTAPRRGAQGGRRRVGSVPLPGPGRGLLAAQRGGGRARAGRDRAARPAAAGPARG